ncbi:MAG TPA: diadenylate cyclase, partial [Planctomycetota bacterium]
KETIQVPVLQEILSDITPYLVIVVVILFQPELRHGITRFGHTTFLRFFSRDPESDESLGKVVAAAQRMAKERVGALIAFERSVSLAPYYESAVQLEAPISAILLETIFFPGSPLHDGAVIVSGNTIRAAACLLPLTENQEVQRRMGTRHRAALGLTEEADAITLVVSEETGRISLCANGEMRSGVPFDQLEHELRDLLRSERRSRSGREADSETAEAVAQGGPSAEDGAGDETPAASAAPAGPRTETAGRADAPAPSGKEATAS